MRSLKIGVLDILVDSPRTRLNLAYRAVLRSSTPASGRRPSRSGVGSWGTRCPMLYYGQRDPKKMLPDDLDFVFISTYTQSSACLCVDQAVPERRNPDGDRGPHARSFPTDCLRFFDWVVLDCDKTLLDELLRGAFDRGSVVTSGRALREIPSVEERMPEIAASAFAYGKPVRSSMIPLLSSVGCPYASVFCVDWNNPYALLPLDRLETDLKFVSDRFPGTLVAYHDPNFGVKFDQVLSVMERLPAAARNPYIMESFSLPSRRIAAAAIEGHELRLHRARHRVVAGVLEQGRVGATVGQEKLDRVVAHVRGDRGVRQRVAGQLHLRKRSRSGDEPVELTKEFMRRLPFVWPTVNIPTPFGGTPLYDQYLSQGRVLRSMPFLFYYTPFLVTTVANYHPIDYYAKLTDLYTVMTSSRMMVSRVFTEGPPALRVLHVLRSLAMKLFLSAFRRIGSMLETDRSFLDFHEGRSVALPDYYRAFSRESSVPTPRSSPRRSERPSWCRAGTSRFPSRRRLRRFRCFDRTWSLRS